MTDTVTIEIRCRWSTQVVIVPRETSTAVLVALVLKLPRRATRAKSPLPPKRWRLIQERVQNLGHLQRWR